MSDLGVSVFWRFFRWLPGYFLKKKFTSELMNSLITIDADSSKESLRANLSDLPVCDVWLRVSNRSPFHVTLDRAKLGFYCVRTEIDLPFRRSVFLPSGAEKKILVSADIPEAKANLIARGMSSPDPSSISGEVDVKVKMYFFSQHAFVKHVGLFNVSEYVVSWQNRLKNLEDEAACLQAFRDQRDATDRNEDVGKK